MTNRVKLFLLLLIPISGFAQKKQVDDLLHVLKTAKTDSARFIALGNLELYYLDSNPDSALFYGEQTLSMAKTSADALDEAICLDINGYELTHLGKYPDALQCFQRGIKIVEDPKTGTHTLWKYTSTHWSRAGEFTSIHSDFGDLLGLAGNKKSQLFEYNKVRQTADPAVDADFSYALMSIGREYTAINKLDSALILEQLAEKATNRLHDTQYLPKIYVCTGNIYLKKKDNANALSYYHKAIIIADKQNDLTAAAEANLALTRYFLSQRQKDSSFLYAVKTIQILHLAGSVNLGDAYYNLSKCYLLTKNIDSAYKYQELALTAKDSNYNATLNNLTGFQKLSFTGQLRVQQLEKEKEAVQARIRIYILLAGIGILLLIATIFYRNNLQKQKANKVLEKTLVELKSTQTQLIQSEKMASLGELTAGIAHEIQNPLNFVNNFSDVSRELMEELNEELDKGDIMEAKAISIDVIENLGKINHHGKRADSIVKGMLEHSRTSVGQKELIDLNTLADEYLRLSYHGLRAKDKSFNAELITHFDPKLPKVTVIPQDIGRVFLNLFNNAFYAVNQKKKTAGVDFKPQVSVATSSKDAQVIIKVKDNGIGMPDSVKEKIMQPFFTTKPTGEGTGLGLSLTYDMVVKGHGGNISVDTIDGEFTEFTIILPIT